ncbi:MAG: hypothetical protein EP343_09940 [Deltaproteobacteria bacterium]|nr:MAG: hypothetical protein EP343_09940 [Deltaproteobacteria bacterium]
MSERNYYILQSSVSAVEDGMMLYGTPDLPDDMNNDWMFGRPFTQDPEQPIPVTIQEGCENSTPISFYYAISIASQAFVDALHEAGVENVVSYDAVLETVDEEIKYTGYKAINIIGLVKIAELKGEIEVEEPSDGIDVEQYGFVPQKPDGLLIFRLAEDFSTILVHKFLKEHLESKGFPDLVFLGVGEGWLNL